MLNFSLKLWKVTKAFHIKFDGWRPKVTSARTSGENTTEKLDSEGIKYLSYLMCPLLVGLAVYSLLYTPHKRLVDSFIFILHLGTVVYKSSFRGKVCMYIPCHIIPILIVTFQLSPKFICSIWGYPELRRKTSLDYFPLFPLYKGNSQEILSNIRGLIHIWYLIIVH